MTVDDPPTDDTVLGAAKAYLLAHISTGVRCPCCTQYAREYTRKLNSGMAVSLVRMFQAAGTAWQDKTETLRGFGPAARDESLLRHWGLLEEDRRIVREDGGHAGWWRVTALGQRFVLGRVQVPSHIRLFNNRFLGYQGDLVDIQRCLGKRFDLAELMSIWSGAA